LEHNRYSYGNHLCHIFCRPILEDMRRSSVKHRLINRTSELFAGDPDLMEFAEASTDVSSIVASQLGKAAPRADQKSLCNVLFSDKKGQIPVPQNDSVTSIQVV